MSKEDPEVSRAEHDKKIALLVELQEARERAAMAEEDRRLPEDKKQHSAMMVESIGMEVDEAKTATKRRRQEEEPEKLPDPKIARKNIAETMGRQIDLSRATKHPMHDRETDAGAADAASEHSNSQMLGHGNSRIEGAGITRKQLRQQLMHASTKKPRTENTAESHIGCRTQEAPTYRGTEIMHLAHCVELGSPQCAPQQTFF